MAADNPRPDRPTPRLGDASRGPLILAAGDDLTPAVAALEVGLLVILPTETVYGVAARADRPEAVAALRRAKGRDADKPLQALVGDAAGALALAAEASPAARRLAAAFWPGPLTLVLPAAAGVPAAVRADDGSIGLRCPAHELLAQLLPRTGPLAASSANLAGEPAAVTCAAAIEALGEAVAVAIDGGPAVAGRPSTVARLTTDSLVILREGALNSGAIRAVAGFDR